MNEENPAHPEPSLSWAKPKGRKRADAIPHSPWAWSRESHWAFGPDWCKP